MIEKIKKEPPYALYFFLLAVVIIALSAWALWVETVKLRPWKAYQKQYIELKSQKLKSEYEKARYEFQSQETQKRYEELKMQLKKATENFQQPGVQEKYKVVKRELDLINEKIKINKAEFQKARGIYLELEYLYHKHQKEEDKVKMAELEKEVVILEDERKELQKKKSVISEELNEFTAEEEKYTAEIREIEKRVEEAKEKFEKLSEVPFEIKQIYINDINKADRCESCHMGINSSDNISELQPFTAHPGKSVYIENHPPEVFGCTMCHRGQGRAVSSADKAHGWVEFWTEPMLKGNMVQATCQTCHGDVQHLRGADLLKKGSSLIEKYGCYDCHKIAGYEDLRKTGPELTEIGLKVNYTYLVNWLLDPKDYIETARMPKFDFSEEEASAIADYLFSMTIEHRIDYSPGEINWNLADKGKALWGQSRCSICHPTNSIGGSFKEIYAPDLGIAGSKINRDWLYNWLKDPKSYLPQTKMPRFRFTDDQIRALVEFIMSEYIDWDFNPQYNKPVQLNIKSIQKGKELIQKYGCFGCHEVKGLEEMKPIGPFLRHDEVSYLKVGEIESKVGAEISSIGNQPIERFDFGVLEKLIPNDRMSYLQQKMKAPRSFRDDLIMPDFQFNEEDIEALTALLLGFTDTNVPTRFKVPKAHSSFELTGKFAQIDYDVKCLNCHMINGKGEEFAPDLSIEGSKVQEQWLRQFLKQPDIIRPMLQQMPLFNLDHDQTMIQGNLSYSEIETIIQYFNHVLVSNEIPENIPDNGLSFQEQKEAGKTLYFDKGCQACHQIGIEGGAVGPNLSNVGNRLTEGYIFKHLENPRTFIPDIVEPNYGFSEDERINLTRYLMSLKNE